MAGQTINNNRFFIQFSYVAKIPMLIIKSMGMANTIINSAFTIFFISPPALNDNLQGFTPVIDESTGKITGYKTTIGGADTVFPFSKLKTVVNVTSDVKPTEKITVTYDNELIAFIAINNTYNERHMFQLLSKTPVYVSTGHYTCETDKHSITINNISYYTEGTFTIYALIK